MKKMICICAAIIALCLIGTLFTGCTGFTGFTDYEGTEKLRNEFIGKHFFGKYSSTSVIHIWNNEYMEYTHTIRYYFYFIDEDTVSVRRASSSTGAYDSEHTEELHYTLKQTRSGQAYVFIEGFNFSDGKSTMSKKEGLRILFTGYGEVDGFEYYYGDERIFVERT
jgi:hypothetical protein